jgi:hypothetical protein
MRPKLARLVRANRRLTQKRAATATLRARAGPPDQAAALLATISWSVGTSAVKLLDGRRPNDERFYELDDLLVAFVACLLCSTAREAPRKGEPWTVEWP